MMCGNEKIRYVHILQQSDVDEEFKVGCVCAEKMTGDYFNPQQREKELRNRASRRSNWLTRAWKTSGKGNPFLNMDGHTLGVYFDIKIKVYKCRIDERFGSKGYKNIREAKIGLFKNVEHLNEKGEW